MIVPRIRSSDSAAEGRGHIEGRLNHVQLMMVLTDSAAEGRDHTPYLLQAGVSPIPRPMAAATLKDVHAELKGTDGGRRFRGRGPRPH